MEDLIRRWRGRRPSATTYEPVPAEGDPGSLASSVSSDGTIFATQRGRRFSWIEYGIFTLLGVAMLWTWNMFLAAAPYFHSRFVDSEWIVVHFQSSILAVSTSATLFCTWLLTKLQKNANYPKRIVVALIINMVCCTVLAISTATTDIDAGVYFAFLMVMVLASSVATAFFQNGLFAFSSGFGLSDYTQGIMAGQAISGVMPCVVQIATVLSVPEVHAGGSDAEVNPRSAFAYFMTATVVAAVTLVAFIYLAVKNPRTNAIRDLAAEAGGDDEDEAMRLGKKEVSMWELLKKLRWFAAAVAVTFCVTMVYPVFAEEIHSVRDPATAPPLFQPAVFVVLGFLVWNLGDLIGRLLPLVPSISGVDSPRLLLAAAVARVLFIPIYLTCNINGRGALISSDAFYLGFVQLFFGMTNGYLGATCMIAAPQWVDEHEREAAGGFMALMLVLGLSSGSLLSFLVAGA